MDVGALVDVDPFDQSLAQRVTDRRGDAGVVVAEHVGERGRAEAGAHSGAGGEQPAGVAAEVGHAREDEIEYVIGQLDLLEPRLVDADDAPGRADQASVQHGADVSTAAKALPAERTWIWRAKPSSASAPPSCSLTSSAVAASSRGRL